MYTPTNSHWLIVCWALALYLSLAKQVVAKPAVDIGPGGDLVELLERMDDSDDSAGQSEMKCVIDAIQGTFSASCQIGASELLKICHAYNDAVTKLNACPASDYRTQWLSYIQMEDEQLECNTVFEWEKAVNSCAIATPTTAGNASAVGESTQEKENELDRALAEALNQWAAQLKTEAEAVDKGTGSRNDFDEAELERQRAVMDQIFKEIYGAESQTGKEEVHLHHPHAAEELSEESCGDEDAECVRLLDNKLFKLAGSNGSAVCHAVRQGLAELEKCPIGSAKREYGAVLKHMQSELCSGEDEGAIKVVLGSEGSTSAQPQSTTGPPPTSDADEEVKVEEKDPDLCLSTVADEFEAKLRDGGDLCKTVRQAIGELNRCGDSEMKRESFNNLITVLSFCVYRLR